MAKNEPLFYHFVRTHQYDSGGAYPGCYFPCSDDCHNEYISIQAARDVRVIMNPKTLEVDEEATTALRGKLKTAERRCKNSKFEPKPKPELKNKGGK